MSLFIRWIDFEGRFCTMPSVYKFPYDTNLRYLPLSISYRLIFLRAVPPSASYHAAWAG